MFLKNSEVFKFEKKIQKFDEERVFSGQNAFILSKGVLNEIGGRKICRC